ncbi:restriction endonuclease subunit S [Actinomadura madurae]|uniref:restriction endonuclease subunit S n=1 Tax=Actinomadura madurae TaxID=1993 RepID=UPI0020268F87|nr:restriction endonuclease subunit S [Actinomadura madurae]URN10014.1 restriction endonuclease subunit S [Actinomadura madurae]
MRLKNLIEYVSGGIWGEEPDGCENDVLCVRAADFDRVKQRVDNRKQPWRHVDASARAKNLLSPGDLILEKSGGGEKQSVGAVILFDKDEPSVCSNFCARLKPASGYDSRFLAYVFAAAYSEGLPAAYVKQTTGIQNLDSSAYLASPWAVPSLEEQRRIADFLDAETVRIDRLIRSLSELKRLLSVRRMSAIHALVTGATETLKKPSGLSWAHEIPYHWRSARVGFFARMGSGHTPSRSRPEWWKDPKYGWITTGEVAQVRDDRREVITETREKISELGLENSSAVLHPKGTVVLCRTASAGYSAVMGKEMATSQDFVTWTCGKNLDPFYLLWCLRAMRPDLLGRLATGSTHKTIYVPDLQMLKMPVPPIDEQREIVASVRTGNEKADALLDAVSVQTRLLEERRRAVVTAAVTGELDVTTARGVSSM